MNCLIKIRSTFIEIDLQLDAIEEVYSIFEQFAVDVTPDVYEKVEGLRFNYNKLLAQVNFNTLFSVLRIRIQVAHDLMFYKLVLVARGSN